MQALGRYRATSAMRSIFELLVTVVPFLVLWVLVWAALGVGYWLCLLLAVPAAGFLVRLFIIQHDCGHGAFFRRRSANDWVGRIIGTVTLTPYDFWRCRHAAHHAAVGNLDHRGAGGINTRTVNEYLATSAIGRLAYRLFRHPVVMFGLVPAYLFLLHNRLPIGLMRGGRKPWCSTMGTNAAISVIVALMGWLVGIGPFLLVEGPVVLMAASFGMWLFYVQHQFEHTRWAHDGDWDFHEVALHGELELRATAGLVLVHRKHRGASRSSSVQPHPVLPSGAGDGRPPATGKHKPAELRTKHSLFDPRPVGRTASAAHIVSRAPPAPRGTERRGGGG